MIPAQIKYKEDGFYQCSVCDKFKKVMLISEVINGKEAHCICKKCAMEYNKQRWYEGKGSYFYFEHGVIKTKTVLRYLGKRKKYKVQLPCINKNYVVEDWNADMAVDQVLTTMITSDELAILEKEAYVHFNVEKITSLNND